jgi:hypothetical protein
LTNCIIDIESEKLVLEIVLLKTVRYRLWLE